MCREALVEGIFAVGVRLLVVVGLFSLSMISRYCFCGVRVECARYR